MEKLKRTLNTTLLKGKRIRIDRKGKKIILAAKCVDKEMVDNLKIRSRLNRNWRFAKKNNLPLDIQKECRDKFMHQKNKTAVMAGRKKSC